MIGGVHGFVPSFGPSIRINILSVVLFYQFSRNVPMAAWVAMAAWVDRTFAHAFEAFIVHIYNSHSVVLPDRNSTLFRRVNSRVRREGNCMLELREIATPPMSGGGKSICDSRILDLAGHAGQL